MKFLSQMSRFVLFAAFLGLGGVAHADLSPMLAFQVAQWEPLPPEQRRQMRQQMREHWQQAPPEERQRMREERREQRDTLQQMPPEDRSRMRDELRGQRQSLGGGADGGHGPRGRR